MIKPKKERRVWTAARKMQVVLEALGADAKVAFIERAVGVAVDAYDQRQNQVALIPQEMRVAFGTDLIANVADVGSAIRVAIELTFIRPPVGVAVDAPRRRDVQ